MSKVEIEDYYAENLINYYGSGSAFLLNSFASLNMK